MDLQSLQQLVFEIQRPFLSLALSLAILSQNWHRNADFSLLSQCLISKRSSAEEKGHSIDQSRVLCKAVINLERLRNRTLTGDKLIHGLTILI